MLPLYLGTPPAGSGLPGGRLARAVALRGAAVVAIDASPEMMRLARERARESPRIRFVCDDFMVYPMDAGAFDCVLAVATLHHLQPAMGLARMKSFLRRGGVLVLHDRRSPSGLIDWFSPAWRRSGMQTLGGGSAAGCARVRIFAGRGSIMVRERST